MSTAEAWAIFFAALWLATTGLYLIKAAGYDAALDDLRGTQRELDEQAVRTREAEQRAEDALTVLTACTGSVAVDISEDVADLHATAYFDEIAWGES